MFHDFKDFSFLHFPESSMSGSVRPVGGSSVRPVGGSSVRPVGGSSVRPVGRASSSSQHQFPEQDVLQLTSNGFSREAAVSELIRTNGDVDTALINLLAKSLSAPPTNAS